MDQLTTRLAGRLRRALTTWPDARGWAFTAGVGAASLAAMGVIGFSSGLYALGPARTEGLAARAVGVLIAPAIGEEAFFRALLIPDRAETARPWAALAAVTGIFTLWHVVEGKTFLRIADPMFLRPSFLACAASLGLGCGIIRWRTGSLWPAVATHWLAVMIWQTWLGGLVVEA